MDEMLRAVREAFAQASGEAGFTGAHGSGNVTTEARSVSDFDEVALRGLGHLDIQQGDHEALTIEAEDNIIPMITTMVHGRRLEIGFERHGWSHIRPTKPIRFHLTVKALRGLHLSGAGSATAPALQGDRQELVVSGSGNADIGQSQGRALEIVVSGSGDIQIGQFQGQDLEVESSGSGVCRIGGVTINQQIRVSGSGHYRAEDLASETCTIRISGSGRAAVRVARMLDVRVTGSGTVRYIGSPTVNRTVLGSGKVEKLRNG